MAMKKSQADTGRFEREAHPYFEVNAGQVDDEVRYLSHAKNYSLFLTRTGATIVLRGPSDKADGNRGERYFRLRFEGANPNAEIMGTEKLPGTSNYFLGSDPKLWRTRISQFGRVRYSDLYPGVDVVFYFRDGQLEYDVLAAAGADPGLVRLKVEGAGAHLTRDGDIAINMRGKEVVRFKKPQAFQSSSGATPVLANYSLRDGRFTFALGRYDRRRPLTIDPALAFATFVSSNCVSCIDNLSDIAADDSGAYITGSTNAPVFPVEGNGAGPSTQQNAQTLVIKIDPTGSRVLYAAFLGNSAGRSIAVDVHGAAYVSGIAFFPVPANSSGFPLTTGVFSGTVPSNAVGGAAYATKLSADGSTLVYSTLLQQPMPSGTPTIIYQSVSPGKVAVDANGALYVTGGTSFNTINRNSSIWMPLPVTVGAFQTTGGEDFVLKLNPNGTGLDYATYIDGPTPVSSSIAGIAVNSAGDAFVAGNASGSGFPTTSGAYQPTGGSAYVMALNPTGTGQIYSTFFGNGAQATGLALDSDSQAILVGFTSGGATVPVTPNSFCPSVSAGGYVAKFKADGSGLVYSTTLCDDASQAGAVAVDSTGAAYVAGLTFLASNSQPNMLHPIQGYAPSAADPNIGFKFDTSGTLQWATFFGKSSGLIDSGIPPASKLAVDGTGALYVLCSSTIPPTANSFGPASLTPGVGNLSGESPNFLLKIVSSLGAPVPLVGPRQLTFTNQNVGSGSAAQDVQVGNFGDAAASPTVTITGDFSETDNCAAGVPAGQKCDINVVFTPSVTGPRTGMLTVAFGGTIASQTVALNGNAGQPSVTLSPTSLTFGVQAVGTTSGAQQVLVTNGGTGPLNVSSIQATAPFAATNTCGAPVAPGNACTIQVTFAPASDGMQSGTLTIGDNAANSPQTVALDGNVASGGGGGTGGGGTGGGGTGGGGGAGGGGGTGMGLGAPTGGSTSATVTAGSTATYSLAIGGAGVSGTASLACTGAPTGATCSVPSSVTLSATTPSTFNVNVTTTAHAGVWVPKFDHPLRFWMLGILGCLALFSAFGAAESMRMRWRFAPALALMLCACGGGNSPTPTNPSGNSTSAGTYTIVVTAKVGSTTQTQNLTLVVK